MERIRGLKATEDGLHVAWSDDVPESRFPWFWLRDHGHEAVTLHPVTLQRQIFTAAIPDQTRAAGASLAPDGQTVIVDWPDGTRSEFPLAFLWRFRDPRPATTPAPPPVVLWGADIGARLPRVPYHAIMADARGLERWLEGVEIYGFCLAEGVPATPEDTAALARRIGYLRATIFGDFWDFTADLAKADTAYTNLELRPTPMAPTRSTPRGCSCSTACISPAAGARASWSTAFASLTSCARPIPTPTRPSRASR